MLTTLTLYIILCRCIVVDGFFNPNPSQIGLKPSSLSSRSKSSKSCSLKMKLVVGLNKYSHDASCCIVDSKSGQILFAQASKEDVHILQCISEIVKTFDGLGG